jgi:predicted dinucleotide-binding enzyme
MPRPIVLLVLVAGLVAPLPASSQRPTVAIIGTGNMASAMGPRVAEAGYPVVFGSRDPDRPSVTELVERTGPGTRALGQEAAAQAGDLVVLAVPWEAMEQVIRNLGDLRGKVLLDFSGATRPGADGYMESTVATSTSEMIQEWAPGSWVVKTGVPSVYLMEDPDFLGDPPTVMLAADDRAAKEAAGQLMYDIGLDPWDAGPLRNARAVDAFGALFWVPLLQGRDQGIELKLMRSSFWPCTWDVQETYGAPYDVDDLAELPGQGEPLPCEAFRGR